MADAAPCPRCGVLPAVTALPPRAEPGAADLLAALRRRTVWVLAAGALLRVASLVAAPPWWPLDLLGLLGLVVLGRWVHGLAVATTWDAVAGARRALRWVSAGLTAWTAAGVVLVWRFGADTAGARAWSVLHLGVALGAFGVALGAPGCAVASRR